MIRDAWQWIRNKIPAWLRCFGFCQDLRGVSDSQVGEDGRVRAHLSRFGTVLLFARRLLTFSSLVSWFISTIRVFQSYGIAFGQSVREEGRYDTGNKGVFVDLFNWANEIINRILRSFGIYRSLSGLELIFLKTVFFPMFSALLFLTFSHTGIWMFGVVVCAQLPVVLGWFLNSMIYSGIDYCPIMVVLQICAVIA
jgi:hypothetical protein